MSKPFSIFYDNDAADSAINATIREIGSIPVGKTRVVSGFAVTRWSDESFEAGTWGKTRMSKESMCEALESSTNK